MQDIKKDFDNMNKLPLFEIELNNGDYEIYHISIADGKMYANNLSMNLDNSFSLDAHLEALYELCLEDLSDRGLL